MTASDTPIAADALTELLEVSPQVDAAVVFERDAERRVAIAPTRYEPTADRLTSTCRSLLVAAERARNELGREPVTQLEVATPDGHLFVVCDTRYVVAAVTDADPTVGLVFYDLKSVLRALREHAGASRTISPEDDGMAAPVTPARVATDAATDIATDAGSESEHEPDTSGDDRSGDAAAETTGIVEVGTVEEAGSVSRWRRRKS